MVEIPRVTDGFGTGGLAAVVVWVLCSMWSPVVMAQGDWKASNSSDGQVIEKYREMLEEDPREGYVLESLLNKVGRGDRLDGLIEEYRAKVNDSPEDADLRLVLGHLLKARRDWEAAITQYDKAIEIAPEKSQPYASRGDAYLRTQRIQKAREDFERALERVDSASRREELLRKLANMAVQQRAFGAADTYYRRLIESKSDDRYIRLEYASTMMEAQQFDKAAEQFKQVVESATNPGDRLSALRSLGDAYRKMGRMEQAVETYRRGMSMVRPGNWRHEQLRDRVIAVRRQQDRLPELRERYKREFGRPNYRQAMLLGGLSDQVGETEEAIKFFERASRLRPTETEPREKLIELWRRQGRSQRVREAYRGLIDVAPGESRYYFELVRLNMRRGAVEEAKSWLKRIRQRFRNDSDVYVEVADSYLKYGWEEGALEIYRELVEMEPDNPSYIISYGETLYRQGELEEAVKAWRRLLKTGMSKPEAHARLGQVFSEHGMFERGISQYEKAIELAPEALEHRRGLASTYERAKQWNEAIAEWRRVMERVEEPRRRAGARGRIIDIYRKQHRLRSQIDVYRREFDGTNETRDAGYFLAESHLRLGRFDRALDVYTTIVEMDGETGEGNVEALLALERIYRQRGEWQKAITQLERLAELRPKHRRDYYHRMAELSLKLYRDEQAVEYAMKAVEANPQSPEAYARLAEVYRKMGRVDEAVETYREAWRLNQEAYGHAMKLATLLEGRGDWKEAAQLYRRVARGAADRARILEASRRAIDLAERRGTLLELERSFGQLVYRGRQESLYRKVMLELYERMLAPWGAMVSGGGEEQSGEDSAAAVPGGERAIATRAVPILVDALGSQDISQRAVAVRLLGRLGEASAGVPLARMVVDSGEPLRMAAASSLVRLGGPSASKVLARGVDASDPDIREAAIWAMGWIGGARSRATLIELVEEGESSVERGLAAVGLGRIGGVKAEEALIELLQQDGTLNETMQVGAYWALGRLEAGSAVELVSEGLDDGSDDVRTVSAVALGEIGGETAGRALLRGLWSGDSGERRAARQGVRRMFAEEGSHRSVGELAPTLRGELELLKARKQTFEARGVFDVLVAEARRGSDGEVRADVFGRMADVIVQVADERLGVSSEVGRDVVSDLVMSKYALGLLQMEPPTARQRNRYVEELAPLADQVRSWVIEKGGDRPLGLAFVGLAAAGEHRKWLLEHLDHERSAVRAEAVRAVGELSPTEEVVTELSDRLGDRSVLVRVAAVEVWRNFEAEMIRSGVRRPVEKMARRLKDEAVSVQVEGVRTLAHLGSDAAIASLAEAVDGLASPAKVEALRVLSGVSHPKANEVLETYRDHWDLEIRRAAGE